MSFRAKRENGNSSAWTYLQERQCLLQCAQLLKSSSQRKRNQVKSKSKNLAPASEEPRNLYDKDLIGWKPESSGKKNEPKYQTICSILSKSKCLPYAKRPRDPEKFLAEHIDSNRYISKEQMKRLDFLAKPKYVRTRSPESSPSEAKQSPSSANYSLKLPQNLKKEQKNVASGSFRLQNVSNRKYQPAENLSKAKSRQLPEKMKQFKPSERLLKLSTYKPYSPDVVDPFDESLKPPKASDFEQFLEMHYLTKSKESGRVATAPPPTPRKQPTRRRIDELAEPKMCMDNYKRKQISVPGKLSARLRHLALPKYRNFHNSLIK